MRKILPILLALAMVLTLLPVSAFAVGTDRTEDLAALPVLSLSTFEWTHIIKLSQSGN